MPTNQNSNPQAEKLDRIATLLEDLFILESLKAGIKVDDIREILQIRKKRVSDISKHLKLQADRGNAE